MRRTVLTLNALVTLFFGAFFGYTFVGKAHLEGLARDFVSKKTLDYSEPLVAAAEGALEHKVVKILLSDDHESAVRAEIADYRADGPAYISDLTRQKQRLAPAVTKNPLPKKVILFKTKIRAFYDGTLAALIKDLRIFSISNLIFSLAAFLLAYRSDEKVEKSLVWFSFFMCAGVLSCTYMYFDEMGFFTILFRAHLGWWYPVALLGMTLKLCWNHRQVFAQETEESGES